MTCYLLGSDVVGVGRYHVLRNTICIPPIGICLLHLYRLGILLLGHASVLAVFIKSILTLVKLLHKGFVRLTCAGWVVA